MGRPNINSRNLATLMKAIIRMRNPFTCAHLDLKKIAKFDDQSLNRQPYLRDPFPLRFTTGGQDNTNSRYGAGGTSFFQCI